VKISCLILSSKVNFHIQCWIIEHNYINNDCNYNFTARKKKSPNISNIVSWRNEGYKGYEGFSGCEQRIKQIQGIEYFVRRKLVFQETLPSYEVIADWQFVLNKKNKEYRTYYKSLL